MSSEKSLDELVYLHDKKINPKLINEDVYHYSIPSWDLMSPMLEYSGDIESTKILLPDVEHLLVSCLNPSKHKVWRIPQNNTEIKRLASTEWAVVVPFEPSSIDYINAAIESRFFSYQLNAYVTGSTNSHQRVRKDDFKKLKIKTLEKKQMIHMGFLHKNLSEKMVNSKKIIKLIDSYLETLFTSWFIKFEPVNSKNNASAPFGLNEEESKLFPETFIDSKYGKIPFGWEIKSFEEIFDFKEGPGIRNWQYTYDGKGTNFINIRCINHGNIDVSSASQISEQEANGKYKHFHLDVKDIVISTSGTLGRYSIVRKKHLPLILNTSVIRLRPKKNSNFSFLYGYVGTGLQKELNLLATGAVQQNFGPMHLKMISLVVPPISILNLYEEKVKDFIEMKTQLLDEIDIIIEMKNNIFPQIMLNEIISK